MKSTVVVFPFDQFGSGGTGAGAQLLGDAVREVIDDTEEETRPSRADVLRGKLVAVFAGPLPEHPALGCSPLQPVENLDSLLRQRIHACPSIALSG